jgi:hypothetical protein
MFAIDHFFGRGNFGNQKMYSKSDFTNSNLIGKKITAAVLFCSEERRRGFGRARRER